MPTIKRIKEKVQGLKKGEKWKLLPGPQLREQRHGEGGVPDLKQRALLATAGTSELRGGALTETSEKGMLPLPRGQSFV